ncbi:MAG: hypothetical protein CVT61_00190 [Actinobacteria bacterium HGW-Actinobacteria-11]|nr:MAG: hypothetical protein CVT61_00190 [Actinobacteria bacterium HGW-Actinobacteria-11]
MAEEIKPKYLSPAQVCELIPGMTIGNLRQLRFHGKGPRFFKPTPRVCMYSEVDVLAWIESSARTSTAQAS